MWSPMKDPNSNQTVLAATAEMAVHKPIRRWSAARKRDVVLRLLRGESIEAVSRQVAVEPYRLEQWRERALAGLDAGLKDRAEDDPAQAGLGAPTATGSSEEGALGGSIWRCGNQSSQRGRYQLR